MKRPDPLTADQETWRRYLYTRKNTAGWLTETWYCRNGCQKFFTAERNTINNEFRHSPMPAPKI